MPKCTTAALALVSEAEQPTLPRSKAGAPTQPETFVRRARRVKLGRLKRDYLALCTFGRGWTKGEEAIRINIKRRTLAGELEIRTQTLARILRDLAEAGVLSFRRSRYCTIIDLFCTPRPVGALSAPSEPDPVGALSAPSVGALSAPTILLEPSSEEEDGGSEPTAKQIAAIQHLRDHVDAAGRGMGEKMPATRGEASRTIRTLKAAQDALTSRNGSAVRAAHRNRLPNVVVPERAHYAMVQDFMKSGIVNGLSKQRAEQFQAYLRRERMPAELLPAGDAWSVYRPAGADDRNADAGNGAG